MSGLCKDCKHWNTEPRNDVYQFGKPSLKWPQRSCLKVIDVYSRETELTDEQKINLPADLAFVDVYEVYPNELMTGPDFGCIHFSPRQQAS